MRAWQLLVLAVSIVRWLCLQASSWGIRFPGWKGSRSMWCRTHNMLAACSAFGEQQGSSGLKRHKVKLQSSACLKLSPVLCPHPNTTNARTCVHIHTYTPELLQFIRSGSTVPSWICGAGLGLLVAYWTALYVVTGFQESML